ncbi:MAG: METTL5 family protein [Candidatus Hodarchaeales archaeon]|jgi:putative methylase
MRLSKERTLNFLKSIPSIDQPNRALEQYATPQQLAWDMLDLAYRKGDIAGRIIWDLGCGTGILAFGAALMGAKEVIGIDIDLRSLLLARSVLEYCSDPLPIQFIVSSVEFPGFKHWAHKDATVIMNPPFGTRRKGIDMVFLKAGFQVGRVVYSLHKANQPTRHLIEQRAAENGFRVDHRANLTFPIPKMFESHQKEVFPVSVDLYRCVKASPGREFRE